MTTDQIALVAWILVFLFAGVGLGAMAAMLAETFRPGCTTRLFMRLFDTDAGLFPLDDEEEAPAPR